MDSQVMLHDVYSKFCNENCSWLILKFAIPMHMTVGSGNIFLSDCSVCMVASYLHLSLLVLLCHLNVSVSMDINLKTLPPQIMLLLRSLPWRRGCRVVLTILCLGIWVLMVSVQLEVFWVRVLLLTTISVKYVQVSNRDAVMICLEI